MSYLWPVGHMKPRIASTVTISYKIHMDKLLHFVVHGLNTPRFNV